MLIRTTDDEIIRLDEIDAIKVTRAANDSAAYRWLLTGYFNGTTETEIVQFARSNDEDEIYSVRAALLESVNKKQHYFDALAFLGRKSDYELRKEAASK